MYACMQLQKCLCFKSSVVCYSARFCKLFNFVYDVFLIMHKNVACGSFKMFGSYWNSDILFYFIENIMSNSVII